MSPGLWTLSILKEKKVGQIDFCGHTCTQTFVGMESGDIYAQLMHTKSEGPDVLEDFFRYKGCPECLHSDRSKMQTSEKVKQICHRAYVPQCTFETKHPCENQCEWINQEIKKVASFHMKTNSAPPQAWVFAYLHACWCIPRMYSSKLQRTPREYSGGDTPDISALQFEFYEPLLYLNPESSFPNSSEACGRFLGIAENVGDCMTYWILTKKKTVIARSTVRPLTKEDDVEAPQLEGGYNHNVFHWDEKALIEPLNPIHEVKCQTENSTH